MAYYESKQDYINRNKPVQYASIRQKASATTSRPLASRSTNNNNNNNNNYRFNSNSNHNFNFFNNKDFVANKVRHQSRFSKFDVVKTMIDSRTIPNLVSSSSSSNNNNNKNNQRSGNYNSNRRRHSGSSNYYRTTTSTTTTTDEGLFDNDDDDWELEYEEDDGDLDDDIYLDDDNDDNNNDENNDDLFSDHHSYKVKSTTVKTIPNYPQSSLTAYKWEHFGTKEKVNETRRQFFNHPDTREDLSAYLKHLSFVKTEGECRKPLKRVISVQSEHPDLSKIYTPTCTVLHRCSEDTGCCNNNTKCQYKKRTVVHLYFIVNTVGNTGPSGTKVEKLSFYNHTECECRSKNSNYTGSDDEENENGVAGSFKTIPENLRKCKCPDHFTPKLKFDLTCTCVCEEDNQDCIRMKKGKEYFGLTTRMCIMNNNCGIPLCEYGKYMKQSGRCPKKDEKMDVYKKINVN